MGKGLGYIDMHLLASAVLTKVPLWTLDKKLNEERIASLYAFAKNARANISDKE
jgi:hypothetical protein